MIAYQLVLSTGTYASCHHELKVYSSICSEMFFSDKDHDCLYIAVLSLIMLIYCMDDVYRFFRV